MKAMKTCVTAIVLCSIFSICADASEHAAQVSIACEKLDGDVYSFLFFGELPAAVEAVSVYLEPGHELFGAILSHAASPSLADAILSEQPMFSAVTDLVRGEVQVQLPFDTSNAEGFSVFSSAMQDGVILQTHIGTVYSSSLDDFEFQFSPRSSGCYTIGKCNKGRVFIGPFCEPCIFRICCDGDTGFIQCGEALCP